MIRMVARSPSRGHRAPWPGELVIGWCLSSVRLQSPACGALVLVTDPEDPRPPLHGRGRETSEKGDALMTVEHGSPLIEEYHRRAAEARRLADTPGVSPDERDDLLEVERRWLSLAACFGGQSESAPRTEPYRPNSGIRLPTSGV